LVVDDLGAHYEVLPEYAQFRQVRNKLLKVNEELGEKINPVLEIISGVTGLSNKEVAERYIGMFGETEELEKERDGE
jgi:hypothetical protein